MIETTLYEFLERISTLLKEQGIFKDGTTELESMHMLVLNYLTRCNRFSDNAGAIALFLSESELQVDQTIQELLSYGLIDRKMEENEQAEHLAVTDNGKQAVSKIVEMLRNSTFDVFKNVGTEGTEYYLSQLLVQLQAANGSRTFGQCQTCKHFIRHGAGDYQCGLTQGKLYEADIARLCAEHTA